MAVIPMIGLLVSVLFFRKKYKLSDAYLDKILAEVQERKNTGNKAIDLQTAAEISEAK